MRERYHVTRETPEYESEVVGTFNEIADATAFASLKAEEERHRPMNELPRRAKEFRVREFTDSTLVVCAV